MSDKCAIADAVSEPRRMVTIGIDGATYTLQLTPRELSDLRSALNPFVGAARSVK